MPTKKPRIQTILEENIYQTFKELCETEMRTESQMGAYIITKYIEEYREKYEIKQAIPITKPENINIKSSKGVIAGDNNGTIKVKK